MTAGGSITSSHAALCLVQVSEATLQKDWVLQMVLKYLQQLTYQVTIKTEKKDNILSMKMGGGDTMEGASPILTQRNAILRSLIGMALHGTMDLHYSNEIALCWNGGYTSTLASTHGTSIIASIQTAATIHFMTLASSLRNRVDSKDMLDTVVEELNQALDQSSFLVPFSATATLADIDVCYALLSLDQKSFLDYPANVQRWMIQLVFLMQQLATFTNVLPAILQKSKDAIQSFLSSKPVAPPLFFDGTEDVHAILSELYSTTKGSSTKTSVGSKRTETVKEAASSGAEGATNNVEQQQGSGKIKLTKQEKKAAAKADVTNNTKEKKKEEAVVAETAAIDVMALDIRVGKILNIWPHESADKLYCEEIDLGNGEIRQIASGLRPFYTNSSDLQGKMVLVLCNLKKRTLVGFPSHGMVLCASNADHTSVELVAPPPDAIIGERIHFDGLDAREPEPESKVTKKKIFESIAPDLRTDAEGFVVWKTHRAKSSAGPVRAINHMPNASVS